MSFVVGGDSSVSISIFDDLAIAVDNIRAAVLCPLGPAPWVAADPEVMMPTPIPNFRPDPPSFPVMES